VAKNAVVRRGPTPALLNAQKKLMQTKAALARSRSNAKGNLKVAPKAISTVAGGGIAGALQAFYPDVAGMDSRLIAGGLGLMLGAFGLKGKNAEYVICASAGTLACWAQDQTEMMLAGPPDAVVE